MTPNEVVRPLGVPPDRRVLLVEDDEDILDSMSSVLESAGYLVDACVNGKEALDRLHRDPADAIVLDLMMPVMNGWEFITAKKADPALAEIPVVAISADSSPQATAIRADSYIPKPFDENDLVAAVGRVLLEADRRKLAQRLDETERLAFLGMVAAGVGHEINNPLAMTTASVTLVECTVASLHEKALALSQPMSPQEIVAWLEEPLDCIQDELRDCHCDLERIRRIVGNLRKVSRRGGDERTLLDVSALLESVISMATAELHARILLVREYNPGIEVLANETQLGQVFLNLMVNAAQSIPKDGAGHILVRAKREGAFVVVEVRDTGRGMTEAQRERVFEPFFTTKGQLGGTGLGLSICKEIVENHDGTIDVTSEFGRGSKFIVRLPAASEQIVER